MNWEKNPRDINRIDPLKNDDLRQSGGHHFTAPFFTESRRKVAFSNLIQENLLHKHFLSSYNSS